MLFHTLTAEVQRFLEFMVRWCGSLVKSGWEIEEVGGAESWEY